jgi:hypothetical protein
MSPSAAPQSRLRDRIGAAALASGEAEGATAGVARESLDPLVAALDRAVERAALAQSRGAGHPQPV